MCAQRAVYLWTGYWSFNPAYLAQEPTDPENIPFATCLTLFGLSGVLLAWPRRPFEALRYGGVLFLFPLIYYFIHPEAYRMRPLDPLVVILGCYAIQTCWERVVCPENSVPVRMRQTGMEGALNATGTRSMRPGRS